jgi:hypothetical protein
VSVEMLVNRSDDNSRAERLAAWIKREVDRAPPLRAEQIEKLRGLLPYPHPAPDTSREPYAA